MVTLTSSGCSLGAQSRNTVRSFGSSTALRTAFEACSVIRSASSMRTTCQRAVVGIRAARSITARISLTPSDRPSVATSWTSAWVRAMTVWHTWHASQPRRGHCRAAAKALAATERPEPGGPVKSHA